MEDTTNMFPGLDQDTMNALMASEKNWNTDFKGGIGGTAQSVTAAVDFTAQLPNLITYVTSYITESVTSYLTNAIADMLSIDPSQIISNAGQKIPNFIKGPGEIMGELLKDAEDISEELSKQGDLKLVDNINKAINDKVGDITNKINDKLSYVSGAIESIGKYAYMGPNWVKSKIDIETKKVSESCFKGIASIRDNTKKHVQEQIDKLSEGIAQKQAEIMNQQIQEKTKEQLDEVNKKKAEAMTKAKTAITNAKLKIMALIGG